MCKSYCFIKLVLIINLIFAGSNIWGNDDLRAEGCTLGFEGFGAAKCPRRDIQSTARACACCRWDINCRCMNTVGLLD